MRHDQHDHGPEQPFVHALGEFMQSVVAAGDRRQVEQPEPLQREAGSRIHHPAADRHRQQQRIDAEVGQRCDAVLPARRARYRCRRTGIQAPSDPHDHQRQDGHADRLVHGVGGDLVRPVGHVAHAQADPGHDQDQQDRGPVQQLAGCAPAIRWIPLAHRLPRVLAWDVMGRRRPMHLRRPPGWWRVRHHPAGTARPRSAVALRRPPATAMSACRSRCA